MKRQEDKTYLGKTIFKVEGHKKEYEITWYTKHRRDWDYSLHFAHEPGDEEQLLAVDHKLEEDDDFFDHLLDAAWDTLPENEVEEDSEETDLK
ncbi:hypothetical protein [Paenibacillus shirakamiensis]|nr:hypothetical protein [Paenibacillus shirakamiensis]